MWGCQMWDCEFCGIDKWGRDKCTVRQKMEKIKLTKILNISVFIVLYQRLAEFSKKKNYEKILYTF